jgi:hypothetical protein
VSSKRLSDQKRLAAVQKIKHAGEYLEIAPDERWLLVSRCAACRRPVLIASTCYECATGKPNKMRAKHVFLAPDKDMPKEVKIGD